MDSCPLYSRQLRTRGWSKLLLSPTEVPGNGLRRRVSETLWGADAALWTVGSRD
jgi:hypothetical protein